MTPKQEAALRLAREAFSEIEWSNDSQWQSDRAKVAIAAIDEALAEQPAQQQEPVAWMYQCSADSSGPVLTQHKKDWAESGSGLWIEKPLYTSPQPAQPSKPLTDEQIKRMAAKWFLSMYWPLCNTFARAIEAAHGIKEKNNG